MVLIICTKNESNLTIGTEIWFRTDKKCGWTEGMDNAKTISLRLRREITSQKYIFTCPGASIKEVVI